MTLALALSLVVRDELNAYHGWLKQERQNQLRFLALKSVDMHIMGPRVLAMDRELAARRGTFLLPRMRARPYALGSIGAPARLP
jgi:hypothetical protein